MAHAALSALMYVSQKLTVIHCRVFVYIIVNARLVRPGRGGWCWPCQWYITNRIREVLTSQVLIEM